MPYQRWMAIVAIAAAPIFAAAEQEKSPPKDPADPSASTLPVSYQSSLDDYRPMSEDKGTPDKTWRAANQEMERLGGHAGHIKTADDAPQRQAVTDKPAGHGANHQGK